MTILEQAIQAIRPLDAAAMEAARARQNALTQPPGSLGRLEALSIQVAGITGQARPVLRNKVVITCAGDHGVVAQGVSAFPPEVTSQMLYNFLSGGAAINAISSEFGYGLYVTPIDLNNPTADFSRGPAMGEEECLDALNIGAEAINEDAELVVFGEMGIGNTTVASALAAAVLGGSGSDWAGRGTGHDDEGVRLKATVIDEALALHQPHLNTPFDVLHRLGGREIAAMAGGIIAARQKRIPVILDGFVVSAAAAVIAMSGKNALDHCLAGHVSAEQAHRGMLEKLSLQPLLDIGMRLGEGTGAALAVQIVRAAAATHGRMATFDEAGVSDRDS